MRAIRRSQEYQCLVIDLALLGKLSENEAEMLIGGGVPAGLCLPNGSSALKPSNNSGNQTPAEPSEPSEPSEPVEQAEPTEPADPETTENN